MKRYGLSPDLLDILWYTPAKSENLPDLIDDIFYEKLGIASFRSGWENESAFAAVKGADTGASHFHYDGGTFVYDWGGVRFAYELGRDSYAVTPDAESRKLNYKIRAEGHNTLVINPTADPGQRSNTKASIVRYKSDESQSFAIIDMTSLYRDYGKNDGYTGRDIKRGLKLDKKTDSLIVQDEIHLTRQSELYWFMHTGKQIALSDDKKSAVISQNGVQVKAELLSDTDAQFMVMDAWILNTTPEYVGQGKNKDYKKLAIHMENVQDVQIAVVLSPFTEGLLPVEMKPLIEW